MKALYERTFDWMDRQHRALCRSIPPPQRIDQKGLTAFRFVEKRPDQAMIQQLARIISGLRATFLLLEQGHLQEQIALCRMLHDIEEDVTFLALASRQHPVPGLLTDHLDAFFCKGSRFGKSGRRSESEGAERSLPKEDYQLLG